MVLFFFLFTSPDQLGIVMKKSFCMLATSGGSVIPESPVTRMQEASSKNLNSKEFILFHDTWR